jgi:hypothetical protein
MIAKDRQVLNDVIAGKWWFVGDTIMGAVHRLFVDYLNLSDEIRTKDGRLKTLNDALKVSRSETAEGRIEIGRLEFQLGSGIETPAEVESHRNRLLVEKTVTIAELAAMTERAEAAEARLGKIRSLTEVCS